jgi:hypothetical protein
MADVREEALDGGEGLASPRETYQTASAPGLFSITPWPSGPPARVPELAAGALVARGRFSILEKLGEGGMGTVYAAFDRERQAEVALKTLIFSDAAAVRRMKHEFRTIADVVHPNLVALHELLFEEGRCFFTMDLVRGRTFSAWVGSDANDGSTAEESTMVGAGGGAAPAARGRTAVTGPRLDVAALRASLVQLVAGVDAIHRAGKLHRDLKPSNVLVTERGEVVILDFGLVRDLLPGAAPGAETGLCGTPHYMSPEQAATQPAQPASDWYSVGVMLFEALTGQLPFRGSRLWVMTAKQSAPAPSPDALVEGLPPDLVELCCRLLATDARQRPGAREILALLGQAPAARAPARGQALVGREEALGQLREALRGTQGERRMAWVQVTAPAGYGKSALLEAFRVELLAGGQTAVVLSGRCYERESVPYKALDAVVEALARHLALLPPEELAPLLPPDLQVLAQLFPALRAICAPPPELAVPEDPRPLRRRAALALRELLDRVGSRRPVAVLIDDLQWGDTDSAWLILDLLRGEAGRAPRLLLVTAWRSDEAAASPAVQQLRQRQAALADEVDIRALALDRLDETEARVLAASLLERGSAAARAQAPVICREAAGSPLLIGELAAHALDLDADGQTLADAARLSLDELVRARVDRLAPQARALFDLVCVSGRSIGQRLVCAAARVPEAEGDNLVRLLRAARLLRIRTAGAAVDVYHDRIRQAGLAALTEDQLRLHHRALADAYAGEERADPEALALHFGGAGDRVQGARHAERAGEVAERALAFDRAARMFRLALELDPGTPERRRALISRLGRVLSDARRGSEAALQFQEAAAQAPPEQGLALRLRAAEQWLVSGRTDEGMRAYREVLAAVGIALPESPRAALTDLLLVRARLRLRGLAFEPRPEEQVPPAEILRLDACKGSWPLGFVDPIQAAALQARYLWLALRAREPYRVALGLGMEAIYRSAEGPGDPGRIAQLQEAAKRLVADLDRPHARAFLPFVEGHVSYLRGAWRRCSEGCEQAERILESCRNVTWEVNSNRYFWANALVYQGRWRELGARLDDWLQDAEDRSDHYAWSGLKLVRSVSLTLAAGDAQAARREVAAAMDRWGSPKFGVQSFLGAISLVQLDLYQDDPAAALARLDQMWPAFSRSLMTRIHVCRVAARQHDAYVALAAVATLPPGKPWPARARRLLARARKDARKLRDEGTPWSDAFAAYIEAASAHLTGDGDEARRRLEQAAAAFETLHMHLFAAATRRRLGGLVGGAAGRTLVEEADAAFRRQGIARPEKLAAMMAPACRPS